MKLWVGTSGFSYKAWVGSFYPEGTHADEMLPLYSKQLHSVEINNTFYRLPTEALIDRWASEVDDSFRFAIKASRRITHIKKLQDVEGEVTRLFDVTARLKAKYGVILFQLPPSLKKDLDRLAAFLNLMPAKWPAALECRHPSWASQDVYELLKAHNVAWVMADTEEAVAGDFVETANFGYVRMRADHYSDEDLADFAKRVQATNWKEAFVYFKHEDEGLGAKLALQFRALFKG